MMAGLGKKVLALLLLFLGLGFTCFAQQTLTVPDDYSTIQAAIDAVEEHGVVMIAAGIYHEDLVIQRDCALRGENLERVQLVGSIIITRGIVKVSDLTNVEGGIRVQSESHVALVRLDISDCETGLEISGGSSVSLFTSSISANHIGIMIADSASAVIEKNVIHKNTYYGIVSVSKGKISGTGNTMSANGTDLAGNLPGELRIPLAEPTEEEILYPNQAYSSLQAAVDALVPGGRLLLQPGDYQVGITISKRMQILAKNEGSVTLRAEEDFMPVLSLIGGARLSLQGLRLIGGCRLGSTAEIVIESSTVTGNLYGLSLQDYAQAAIVNTDIEGRLYGLRLAGSAQATISDSKVTAHLHGIHLEDSSYIRVINTVFDGEGLGTGIVAEDSSKVEVEHSIFASGWYGVELADSSQASIKNSTISENQRSGIKATQLAKISIVNSEISRNGALFIGHGVELSDSAQVTLEGNTIQENSGCGVWIHQFPCFGTERVFLGSVSGKGNAIPDSWELNGNETTAVCPLELRFLLTEEGGEYLGSSVLGKTWDDAVRILQEGAQAYGEARFWDAIGLFEEALIIMRELDKGQTEGVILTSLGNCYQSLSDYQQAIDYYEQSLAIKREIGDRAGEAASLNNLGSCYESLSDYQRAIDYHEQSLVIKREIKDQAGEAASLGNLGICYNSLADYQRAIVYYELSLLLFMASWDRSGEAASLNNLGNSYRSLSDYQRAIDYHEQALAIFREIEDRASEAAILNNLGNCYYSLSDYQRAIDYHEQSLAILREIGNRAGEAKNLGNLGNCYYYLSDYQRAINYYEQAFSLSVELGTRETERTAHWGLGRTYRIMEDPQTALTHYEAAIEIVESIRGTVGEEELRQSYFGSVRPLYEEYLELLLELGRNELTILVAERLRARTFLDGLYQAGLAPEQLLHTEQGIVVTGDQETAVMDPEAITKAVAEAQGSLLLNEAALEYMVTDDGIYLWILTSEGTLGPRFIPYDREQLLRDVVALRRAVEPQVKEVDGQPKIIFSDPSELLGRFYELLIQPVLPQLADVVDTLIVIPSGPLWYVPFSALVMTDRPQIEFGPSGPGGTKQYRQRYLVDEYTLAFLPSLASLPLLMEERAPSTAMYLALANPTLSEEQQKEVGSHYQFSVLETACLAFAECIGKGKAVQEKAVHVQEEALEARAYNEAAGHKVLVYACHGIFNPSVPLDSRLLLAPSQDEKQETTDRRLPDGDYYASEVILTNHEGVDLVILAACETLLPTLREVQGALGMTLGPESDKKLNMGQLELIVAGDEVVGLSRAFLSSGAQSVLGTLWQANPTAIDELLEGLCEAHKKTDSWAVALRQAQLAILQKSDPLFTLTYQTGLSGAHPWFWAPYQLIGRWR